MVNSIIGQFGLNRDEVLDLSQRDFEDKLMALHPDSPFMSIMRARSSTHEERKNFPPELLLDIHEFTHFKEQIALQSVCFDYSFSTEEGKLFSMLLSDIKKGRPDGRHVRYSVYEAYIYILSNEEV